MTFTTENLNVGDKAIMKTWSNSFVGTIIKKTPKGMIDVVFGQAQPERFGSKGDKRGKCDTWSRDYLIYWTQQQENEIQNAHRKGELSRTLSRFNFNNLELTELEQIYKIVRRENRE